MANITSFPFVVQIIGDNVSTSAVVGLGYTPATATLVSAYDANNNNVTANILSVVPGSSQVTINFVAAFSGTVTIQLALSNASFLAAQLQPVTGTITAVTAITNALPAGTNQIGHVIADSGSTTAVTGTVTVAGNKTGNAGVPDGMNLGVLPALANAANPAWTEGDQVLQSVDLSGHQRINVNKWGGTLLGTPTNFGTTPGAVVAGSVNSSLFIGTTAAVAASAGIQKVGITGGTGATLDAIIGAATAPTNAIATLGVYQSTIPALTAGQSVAAQCDTTGSYYVTREGRKATYRAVASGLSFIAGASPLFSLTGSASKTVRITHVRFSATAATGATADVAVARFSALSGGTSAAVTVGKMDTTSANATAAPFTWSVAATTATLVALLTSERYEIVTAAVSVLPELIEWEFGDINGQALVLRGTSDFMGLKISATGTTPVGDVWIEWTEE